MANGERLASGPAPAADSARNVEMPPMSASRMAALALTAALLSAPAAAQTIIKPEPPATSTAKPGAPKEVTLPARKFVFIKGHADFDNVYDALVAGLKKVRAYLGKEGIAAAGPAIARYTDGGESGFQFEAGYPVAREPKDKLPEGIAVGDAPSGKFLEFVHRGPFDNIDEAYSAIDDYFRPQGKSSGSGTDTDEDSDVLANSFEVYTADPIDTGPDKAEVHIMVPVK
jgi:effector-binding domain-containing protein